MAVNASILRRPTDRNFYLAAAVLFPLVVFAAYFKSYYFRPLFTDKPLASWIVHAHGVLMSIWVVYFSAQIALIRTKNYRLHMSMGFTGIALAALVVVVGMAAAYDMHLVRKIGVAGIDPYAFFIIPFVDMALFAVFLGAAVYYRKRPAEHKGLMLMTAINFLPPALGRMSPVPPEMAILWSFGVPVVIAFGCVVWNWRKYGKLNRVFAVAALILAVSYPLRIYVAGTQAWHDLIAMLAP